MRVYLKTGHPLKERKEAAWAAPELSARDTEVPAVSDNTAIQATEYAEMPALPIQEDMNTATSVPLDGMQIQLLHMLLRGEPVQELIAAQRKKPLVIRLCRYRQRLK